MRRLHQTRRRPNALDTGFILHVFLAADIRRRLFTESWGVQLNLNPIGIPRTARPQGPQ